MPDGITRRKFLKLGMVTAGAAVLAGCQSPRQWVSLEPYVRPPEEQLAGQATWYASTCRQCPAGCGIVVRIMNGRAVKIEGNAEHPLNRGKLCARGQAGLQVLYNPDRLPEPVKQTQRGTRQFQALTWNDALNMLFTQVQAAGSSVAVWGGSSMSGHLHNLLQRFTTALGAPAPIMWDLYTGMHGYHALHSAGRTLFNRDVLPVYDLSHADIVFSFGADILGTWLSAVRYGIEFGDFRGQPLGKRGYLVQFEPRMSMSGAKADRWLPIRPGSGGLIAQAIARIIVDQRLGPAERIERARTLVGAVDVSGVANASDISADDLVHLARIFATADRPLALPGSALSGQENALEATLAVQALNAIAGTAGQSGGLGLFDTSPVSMLAQRPLSALAAAQNLIEQMRNGKVQVLLVHGANPAYDLPEQFGFVEALKHVPFVASFAPILDETAAWADLIMPDRTYLESWGFEVVSPSFGPPVVGSQQPVVTPVYDARSTADVLLTIAKGIPEAARALPWTDEVSFLKEITNELPPGSAGGSGAEVRWSRFLQHGGWWSVSTPATPALPAKLSTPLVLSPTRFQGDEKEYPFFLELFMTELLSDGRAANQPWLQGSPDAMTTMAWQTWVELNPQTAQKLGIGDGDVVRVTSPYGAIEAPAYTYPAIRPDTIGIPIGQGHTDYGRYARNRGSNAMRLVGTQSDTTGSSLAWSTVRVKIERTEKRVAVALFENKTGVTEGFINKAFPGQ
jgi:anaerobic selenocysteine-containing dehydrogenase